ncbi:MAG: beta-(1-6) glucans synthase [Xanthobacteraceae bacterium]
MRLPLSLFVVVVAAIVGAWWWLGAAVRMPPAPLAANEKLYCVSYSPFRGGQSPLDLGIQIDPRQIEDDMVRLSRLTECVRTYSTRNGLDRVPEIAERHGVRVIQGIWLGGDRPAQERDIATAIAIAKRYPQVIRSLVVGNEVLLRGEMTSGDLAATIRSVKAQVAQPVTYADVWEFWLRYREVYEAVDFVTIHILPYWEDFPIPARNAATHVEAIRRKVAVAFPDKEILLGETGWPSAGRMREGALPSPATQARVLHDVLNIAKREGYHVNLIEAFDQPWKRRLEGTVGGHWGLFDAERREPKFNWGVALSNHPRWRLQAAEGVALAALVFAAAFAARRRGEPLAAIAPPIWVGVAAMALGPGILIGWAIENVPVESLTVGDWLRSLTMVGLAIAAPLMGAAALVRAEQVPGFARMLAAASLRPHGRLSLALGLALMLLCVVAVQVALGLVFDPRYKDFPFAPLTAAAIPYLVLALIGPLTGNPEDRKLVGPRGMAESAFAALLGGSAVYVVLNESFANWQAVWLAAVFVSVAAALLRLRDAPGSK